MVMVKKKAKKPNHRTGIIIAAVAITIIVVLSAIGLLLPKSPANSGQTETPAEGSVTIKGTAVCLPHRDTSGPQTLECAFGLKDEKGLYYALKDSDPGYRNVSSLPMNTQVTITGTFEKDTNSKYATIGTIEIASIAE